MSNRTIITLFLFAAAILAEGCGSSDYAGYIKLRYESCNASNGQYEVGKDGRDICSCFFNNGIPLECPEGLVCDMVHQRCVTCEEGKSFCLDGTIHICLNGEWQTQACESKACLNSNQCDPIELDPICCKDASDVPICSDAAENGILAVIGNTYVLDECANGCENGACLPCSGAETRCEENTTGEGTAANLITCRNGYKRVSLCSSEVCNEAGTECGDNLSGESDCKGEAGRTRCVADEGLFIQQLCTDDAWTFQKNCEYGCSQTKDICASQESVHTPVLQCLNGKYKCEYDIVSNQYKLYHCKNGSWDNGKLCDHGCVINYDTQEGYCKSGTEIV